jgi:cellobiose phosphorylase
MDRLITESFLGLQKEGNKLKIAPCVPKEWISFNTCYRFKSTVYQIEVDQKNGTEKMIITVDGIEQQDKIIKLTDDGIEQSVQITASYQNKLDLKGTCY